MNAPNRIYLQDENTEHEFYEGVTWCKDKIGENDTEYIKKNKLLEEIDFTISCIKANGSLSNPPDSDWNRAIFKSAKFVEKLRDRIKNEGN